MELLANFCIIHRIKLERRNGVVGNDVGMELDGVVDSRISTLDTDTTPTLQSIVREHYSVTLICKGASS